jgi:predicted  nucleic acid-binding Zn-ribbon protein
VESGERELAAFRFGPYSPEMCGFQGSVRMAVPLDEALKRLESALGALDAAVTRRLEAERSRADLETELQIMQDDRARLAVDLESASRRVEALEATTRDVEARVGRAAAAVRAVLDEAGAAPHL